MENMYTAAVAADAAAMADAETAKADTAPTAKVTAVAVATKNLPVRRQTSNWE